MKPVAFDYDRAVDPGATVRILVGDEEGRKLIAGGQSLGPMMNLRLVRPTHLVDVSDLDALRCVEESEQAVFIGAAITHAEIEDGRVPDPIGGMLGFVAGGIAYRAVRNRGTMGGSIAHADPAADWVSLLTVADAQIHLVGAHHGRVVPMQEFISAAYTTVLGAAEIVVKIEIPKYSSDVRWGYYKVCRKVGEFADAIGAVVIDPASRYCRVVLGAIGRPPVVLRQTASRLAGTGSPPSLAAVQAEINGLAVGSNAVLQQLYAVAVRRAMMQAITP